jgi:hypothetical protein
MMFFNRSAELGDEDKDFTQCIPLLSCPPLSAKHSDENFKGDGITEIGSTAVVDSDISKLVFMLMVLVSSAFAGWKKMWSPIIDKIKVISATKVIEDSESLNIVFHLDKMYNIHVV